MNGVVSAHGGKFTDAREITESDEIVVMENRKFTNTALPVFSGAEGWYQHIHIVQAIDRTGLVEGLAAYYQSPGRLAGLRRRFESAFRQPGFDPATFATDLGMLAIQGFGDMREQARDTMIRDKFITGQGQCALRRQLDGFAQSTPIGEIVDSCRVWESHSDSNRIPMGNYDSEVGSQSSDSRTWERRKVGVAIEEREPEAEGQECTSFTREIGGHVGPDVGKGASRGKWNPDRRAGMYVG